MVCRWNEAAVKTKDEEGNGVTVYRVDCKNEKVGGGRGKRGREGVPARQADTGTRGR